MWYICSFFFLQIPETDMPTSHAYALSLNFFKAKPAVWVTQVKTLSPQIDLNQSSLYLKRMLCLSFGHILASVRLTSNKKKSNVNTVINSFSGQAPPICLIAQNTTEYGSKEERHRQAPKCFHKAAVATTSIYKCHTMYKRNIIHGKGYGFYSDSGTS